MKRVVVVEDESLVRRGICAMLEQRGNEYTVVGNTESGLKAVPMIMNKNPDIVLLDITIPEKNGLCVLEEIRSGGFAGYVLMLTCHADFELARQAIRLGANEYVLKSELNAKDLLTYLDDIEIHHDHDALSDVMMQKRHNFLSNLLLIGLSKEYQFDLACKDYDLPIQRSNLHFILLNIPNYTEFLKRYEVDALNITHSALNSIMGESLNPDMQFILHRLSIDNYVVLFSGKQHHSQEKNISQLRYKIDLIHKNIKTFLDMRMIIGVSQHITDATSIHSVYKRLISLMSRSFFFGEEITIWDRSDIDSISFEKALEKLKKELLSPNFDPELVKTKFLSFLEQIYPPQVAPDKLSFLFSLNSLCSELAVKHLMPWQSFSKDVTFNYVVDEVKNLYDACSVASLPDNRIAMLTMQYIDKHYTSDIPLESIAEVVGVSNSYLSRTFNLCMGQSVSAYIMKKRIELAKKLISSTNLKFYEIAEQCGLNSSTYFATVFKKETGKTPQQFRDSKR